jgi:hypothetical protein
VPALRAHADSAAIESYLRHESPGQLIRSLEAYLPRYLADKSCEGTSLYGRHLTLPGLIAAFLKKLPERTVTALSSRMTGITQVDKLRLWTYR